MVLLYFSVRTARPGTVRSRMTNSVSRRTGLEKSSTSPMPRLPLPSMSSGMVMVPLWLEAALRRSVSFSIHSPF